MKNSTHAICRRRAVMALLVALCMVLPVTVVRAQGLPAAAVKVVFVNHAAAPGGDGTTWPTAFNFLQDGLAAASAGDEIWVAQGTYYPDEGAGFTNNDRSASFALKSGIAVYGGFAGTETSRDARAWEVTRSILSGDITQDPSPIPCGPELRDIPCDTSKNSYHVVSTVGVNDRTILDGFTIADGRDTRHNAAEGAGIYSLRGSPQLRNLLITNNRVNNGYGAGMFAGDGAPMLLNVRFTANGNAHTGGGAYFRGADASLYSVQFLNNDATSYAGGLGVAWNSDNSRYGNYFLQDTVIAGNTVGGVGGGLAVFSTDVNANNIIVSGNKSGDPFWEGLFPYRGAGIYIAGNHVTLTNATITGNHVTGSPPTGSAIATSCIHYPGDPDICQVDLNNSILYANGPGVEIGTESKNFRVQNSLVEGSGGSGAWRINRVIDAGGNIDVDPQFGYAVDPAAAPTTAGDFRPRLGSPVVNAGKNSLLQGIPPTPQDIAGNWRVFDEIVDMGAYESSVKCPPAGTTRLYVGSDTKHGNLGTSWSAALDYLQDALTLVGNCPSSSIQEIWVRQGTYYPDEGYYQTANDRSAAFQLVSGVAIYGGFFGNETSLDQRRPWALITTLSGDIAQDDLIDHSFGAHHIVETPAAIVAPNSYHVVVASGTDSTARLDGFAITAGQANGPIVAKQHEGGGLFAESGSPTLGNLALTGNVAAEGGAMTLAAGSNPRLANAWFGGNGATDYGGALHNESSSPTLINVLFSGNRAQAGGGAIYNLASNPALVNVTIASNAAGGTVNAAAADVAPFGGGMFNFTGSKPSLRNTIIWNNQDSSGIGTPSASMRNMDSGSVPTADYCDIQGLAGIPGLIYDGTSIDQNPLFVAPLSPTSAPDFAGDRRLQIGSPAIDAGNNAFNPLPMDLAQQQRITDGNGDGIAVIDMGAYEVPLLMAPRVQLAISASPTAAAIGDVITYMYTVTNTGNITASIVAGEAMISGTLINQDNVAPGVVLTATNQHTVGVDDLPLLVQTFYAWAIAPNGSIGSNSVSALVDLQLSNQMVVTKTASAASAKVGDTITYTFQVENTSGAGLTNIQGADSKLGPVTLPASLASGASAQTTLPYILQESDLPVINNLFTVTASLGASTEVETRGATVQVLSNPGIALDKSVNTPTAKTSDAVTYTYALRNIGTVTLHGIELVDDKLGSMTLPTTTLAPGAVMTVSTTYIVQDSDLPGPLSNTAVATGTGPTGLVRTAEDGAAVAISYRPLLEVQMAGTPGSGLPDASITYTYQVKNVGDVLLSGVTISDTRLGGVTLSATSLAPGDQAVGSKSYVIATGDVPGPLNSVATATSLTPTGGAVQGTAAWSTVVINPNPPSAQSHVYLPTVARH